MEFTDRFDIDKLEKSIIGGAGVVSGLLLSKTLGEAIEKQLMSNVTESSSLTSKIAAMLINNGTKVVGAFLMSSLLKDTPREYSRAVDGLYYGMFGSVVWDIANRAQNNWVRGNRGYFATLDKGQISSADAQRILQENSQLRMMNAELRRNLETTRSEVRALHSDVTRHTAPSHNVQTLQVSPCNQAPTSEVMREKQFMTHEPKRTPTDNLELVQFMTEEEVESPFL